MNILVLGYYNRKNLGDDLFQHILLKRFSNYNFQFLNPDDFPCEMLSPDIIFIGGGDLINDYFIPKIADILDVFDEEIPVYGIGIGFPYPKLIGHEYLKSFDFIQTRTQSIKNELEKILPNRCSVTPDIVRYNNQECRKIFQPNEQKKIGVFLANSINTEQIIFKLSKVLEYIAGITIQKSCKKCQKAFSIHLYAMNTHNSSEDDRIINNTLYKQFSSKYDNIIIHNNPIDINQVDTLFASFYATICVRFHAHILSLNSNVPFISIYSTYKVRDLLISEDKLTFGEQMLLDKRTMMPIDFDADNVCRIFDRVVNLPTVTKFETSSPNIVTLQQIENLLYYKPSFVFPNIRRLVRKVYKYLKTKDLYKYSSVDTAKIITFAITRTDYQEFTYGLIQNIESRKFDLYEAISWIVKNVNTTWFPLNTKVPLGLRKYNFSYFDNDLLSGIHRSGWQYVVEHMKMYHNPHGIIFDSYLDKTFGWNRDFYTKIGILPIRKPWVGVFHHTPDQAYDKNNLVDIINSNVFIQSLKYCKKIIVLSKHLRNWLEKRLININIINVHHPAEFVDLKWTPELWNSNKDKKIIQVGAWLRDPFAIYSLNTSNKLKKYALKGKKMDNYYPSDHFMNKFEIFCNEQIDGINNEKSGLCRHKTNKFIVGMYDWMKEAINSVTLITSVTNDDYDILLSKNIIFIKLIDCSACNTIIECIVRNTPIIINKLPSIIEYLGPDYPLYYETMHQATILAEDSEKILAAHLYLKAKDKSFLNIENYLNNIMLS